MASIPARYLSRDSLGRLLGALRGLGYTPVGPTVRDGAIVYDELSSDEDLPAGWTDVQEPGAYRLDRRDDGLLFGHAVGPHSWKRFLYPARLRLWAARRDVERGTFEIGEEPRAGTRFALFGVRACDLRALGIHDRVLIRGEYEDPDYRSRREGAFVVAVHCGNPSGTCFCASMDAGPRAESGFDLALTEILDEGRHGFVVESGSERGAGALEAVPHREATEAELGIAERAVERARSLMGREMVAEGLRELLGRNYEHPRWKDVAVRCLSCGNCTLACPTCFCTAVEDVTDLTGRQTERYRSWDSCFTGEFTYIHGGNVRASTRARYRQWMTHKLATWVDQFGSSGCVGCGRCITWCPVGIDITEEVRAIRQTGGAGRGGEGAAEEA